ncbi:hypothetical protein ORG27_14800 [Stenotrophomonas lactitubi]|uniref:hypothetical protein n=1 Tax=Stenotrophomonas lactitubi TaxID=2045214 RepID=UPI00224991D9|nr:hypothetical protein [Stenotrophomonas lactitubi]MCX2894846.1 hypothetical protein [Stenotrophomonas lactitubi]
MKNGDQPAIPNALAVRTNDGYMSTSGLTKRELFAAMAMQGIRATLPVMQSRYADVADAAVSQADALLAALEK